ncbi:MAG: hypothetical protein CM1200mP22_25080 [Dehalococcoidia bacterium]|nr:MAG: hypothetical protein CM1200mP22_25080 [Dehalococcoidia bacterium]
MLGIGVNKTGRPLKKFQIKLLIMHDFGFCSLYCALCEQTNSLLISQMSVRLRVANGEISTKEPGFGKLGFPFGVFGHNLFWW